MELPVLNKFCFAFDLKTGCISMGILNSIFTFIMAVVLITSAVDFKAAADAQLKMEQDTGMYSVVYTMVVLIVVLLFIKFLFELVFVYAVYKQKYGILRKYFLFWIVFIVLFIIGAAKTLFYLPVGHIIAELLFIGENFYYVIVIRSYLLSVNEI